MRNRPIWSFSLLFLLGASAPCRGHQRNRQLDLEFQAAVQEYDSGRFPEAAAKLESLLRDSPQSFEVQELAGLVYSAQSLDDKANPHLEKAVELKPNSAAARTNLASNLVRLGKPELAEIQLQKAVVLEPLNFDANHNLGELYVQAGKIARAQPFLEKAQQIDPASYDNGYDLSLAYLQTGRVANARRAVKELLQRKDTAELHNLLGEIEEKDGQFVAAAKEFELAAHGDPSESNLFDWGSELLLHRTLGPAVEVFKQAAARYPKSPRLAIGLGMALYAQGNYDDAVTALLKAADLNPSDPRCYLFLSRAYDSSPTHAEEVLQRFRRYAELQPTSAEAQYYYAMSLWKGKRAQDSNLDPSEIEMLLQKSLALDPQLAEAHLQLGNLYFDAKKYPQSIPEFTRALELNSDLSDAHYRLGLAYVRTGEKERGQSQLAIYQRVREQHLADLEKQRAEIRQFVYSAKNGAAKDASAKEAPAQKP
ncbi:MAG: tetratricopeptide repeat protein [Candidatus Acidiferrum sp.]|jgi:tetratricopeptide (TPR) repeat protein